MTYILLTFAPETSSPRSISQPCTSTLLFLPLVPYGHYPRSPGSLGVSCSVRLMCSCLPKNTFPSCGNSSGTTRHGMLWSALCTGKSTPSPPPCLHSYPILHLSLASAPKVAGIMSPSENSFLSFCKGVPSLC